MDAKRIIGISIGIAGALLVLFLPAVAAGGYVVAFVGAIIALLAFKNALRLPNVALALVAGGVWAFTLPQLLDYARHSNEVDATKSQAKAATERAVAEAKKAEADAAKALAEMKKSEAETEQMRISTNTMARNAEAQRKADIEAKAAAAKARAAQEALRQRAAVLANRVAVLGTAPSDALGGALNPLWVFGKEEVLEIGSERIALDLDTMGYRDGSAVFLDGTFYDGQQRVTYLARMEIPLAACAGGGGEVAILWRTPFPSIFERRVWLTKGNGAFDKVGASICAADSHVATTVGRGRWQEDRDDRLLVDSREPLQ